MRPALALALTLIAPCARADFVFTRNVSSTQTVTYTAESSPMVGHGTPVTTVHTTDTFVPIDPAAGPGILIAGTVANLRRVSAGVPVSTYAADGFAATERLDLRILATGSSDPATLFSLYDAAPTAALVTIGNGLPGAPGPDFSVLLSASATAQVRALRAAGQAVELGFAGTGGALIFGPNVVGDLTYRVSAVPEPTGAALMGVGAVMLGVRRLTRRRDR